MKKEQKVISVKAMSSKEEDNEYFDTKYDDLWKYMQDDFDDKIYWKRLYILFLFILILIFSALIII